ncbi:MAG: hypothetical protein JSR98_13375 [Proteobacteria bacterium]|nr:hypothetical protein [Pseudomonadota bacterium]
MARAYAAALAAGAPPRTLRRDQAKWLAARDAAAHRSRDAVERVYRHRIEALEARPYRACAAVSGDKAGLAGVTHWLLSVPRRIVSPRPRADCG